MEKTGKAQIFRCHSYMQIASMPIAPSLIVKVLRNTRKHHLIAVHYPFPLADIALFIAFRPAPIVVHWHSEVVAQKRLKWLVWPFTFFMLLRAKAIIVTSTHMTKQSFFLRNFRNKITVIPYGIRAIEPVSDDPRIQRSTHKYFLLLGRHVSYKGIDIAIRALEGSSMQLYIAGDGPLFDKHKKLAGDMGLTDQIHFFPHASNDEVIEMLRETTALIVPSVKENEAFALVQLEAMRLAKPIINTNLESSVPWVARHQQEALTVSKGDAKALAGAMNLLSSDPDLAHRLGVNGLKRYQERFTEEIFSSALESLYSKILSNHYRN